MLQTLLILILGGTLKLSGSASRVDFTSSDAGIYAKCLTTNTPAWVFASPSVIDSHMLVDTSITVELTNVLQSCAGRNLHYPCAAHSTRVPSLFWCAFEGPGGIVTTGPVQAVREVDNLNGTQLGVATHLICPLPAIQDVVRVSGYDGSGSDISLDLLVSYLKPPNADGALALTYDGVPGVNSTIIVKGMPVPPLSPPPPSPSSPPAGLCQAAFPTGGSNYDKCVAETFSTYKDSAGVWGACMVLGDASSSDSKFTSRPSVSGHASDGLFLPPPHGPNLCGDRPLSLSHLAYRRALIGPHVCQQCVYLVNRVG